MMMIVPIDVVLLLNDISQGDDVQREQQPFPSTLVHTTSINLRPVIVDSKPWLSDVVIAFLSSILSLSLVLLRLYSDLVCM